MEGKWGYVGKDILKSSEHVKFLTVISSTAQSVRLLVFTECDFGYWWFKVLLRAFCKHLWASSHYNTATAIASVPARSAGTRSSIAKVDGSCNVRSYLLIAVRMLWNLGSEFSSSSCYPEQDDTLSALNPLTVQKRFSRVITVSSPFRWNWLSIQLRKPIRGGRPHPTALLWAG